MESERGRGGYLSKILGNFRSLVGLVCLEFEAVNGLKELRLFLEQSIHRRLPRLRARFRASEDACGLLLVPCCG